MVSPLVQAMTFQNAVQPSQSGIAPTDVIGAYKLATDTAEKNYQLQLAKQQALWGGLAGIGSAGILGFGPSIAKKYFGAGTPTAPAAGGADAAAAAPGVADSGALDSGIATGDLAAGGLPAGTLAAQPGYALAAGGADTGGTMPLASLLSPTSSGTSMAWPFAGGAATAGDVGTGAGTVAGDFGLDAAAPEAGSVLAGLGADTAGVAGADAAATALPDWLASLIPFLAV